MTEIKIILETNNDKVKSRVRGTLKIISSNNNYSGHWYSYHKFTLKTIGKEANKSTIQDYITNYLKDKKYTLKENTDITWYEYEKYLVKVYKGIFSKDHSRINFNEFK